MAWLLVLLGNYKTVLSVVGFVAGAIYFALVPGDYGQAWAMLMAALMAAGLRHATAKVDAKVSKVEKKVERVEAKVEDTSVAVDKIR